MKGFGVQFKLEIEEAVDGIPIEIKVTSIGDDHINDPENSVKARPFEVEIREKKPKRR